MSDKETSPNDGKYTVYALREKADFERWDNFVTRSPQANPFAISTWLNSVARATGAKVDIWVAAKGDEWLAGVPLYYRSVGGRKICFVPALTAYSSYLYSPTVSAGSYPSSVTSAHIAVSKALAQPIAESYLNVTQLLLPGIDDVRPWQWLGWQAVPRYTYRLNLMDELKPSHSVRKHVRKCGEAGFRVSGEWDLRGFWRVYDATQERQDLQIGMNRQAFFDLANALHVGELAWMVSAIAPDGEIAASRIELSIPDTSCVFDWVAGGLTDYLSSGVNPWLMTQTAAEARQRGYETWDLCGADFETIARFKSELGGKLEHYFQISAPQTLYDRGYVLARALGARFKRMLKR